MRKLMLVSHCSLLLLCSGTLWWMWVTTTTCLQHWPRRTCLLMASTSPPVDPQAASAMAKPPPTFCVKLLHHCNISFADHPNSLSAQVLSSPLIFPLLSTFVASFSLMGMCLGKGLDLYANKDNSNTFDLLEAHVLMKLAPLSFAHKFIFLL